MGISLGLVGLGQFGTAFVELFKHHPAVDRIALCDREPERVRAVADNPFLADKLSERDRYTSLDAICASDLDALVIITQPWLHAPQAVQAMEAGKHVYSAVPLVMLPDADEILDWCDTLVETCTRTGVHYMLGETSYFHPDAMFCRRQAAAGAFGDFVYGEGEYLHDVDAGCNLRRVYENRLGSSSGREWQGIAQHYQQRDVRGGPMHYPTHSVAGPVCVMGTHAVSVNCHGWANRTSDPFFAADAFSNEVALFKMANGASVRIAEMRECGGAHLGRHSETFRLVGTEGAYSEGRWMQVERSDPPGGSKPEHRNLTVEEMRDQLPPEVLAAFKEVMHKGAKDPQSLDFVPGGHQGSHPYLVHEFVDAVATDRRPAINAWQAARYMAMGASAHKSALLGGETVSVPDWGDAPGAKEAACSSHSASRC